MTESFDTNNGRRIISEAGAERKPSIHVERKEAQTEEFAEGMIIEVGGRAFKKPPEGISTKNVKYFENRDRLPTGDINEVGGEIQEAQEKTLESLSSTLLDILGDPDMDSERADGIILAMSALKQRLDKSKDS